MDLHGCPFRIFRILAQDLCMTLVLVLNAFVMIYELQALEAWSDDLRTSLDDVPRHAFGCLSLSKAL